MPSEPFTPTTRPALGRAAVVVLTIVAIVAGLLAAPVSPAGAAVSTPRGQMLQWTNGGPFISTGANSALMIDLGRLAFVNDCPSGFNDFVFPQADIYIVPAGSVSDGAALEDVSGTPNTTAPSGSVFASELIGFTSPTGAIGEGDWAVVYDECQNGIFEADTDAVFDPAIRVTITADVPPLPGIDGLKAAAHEEALIWADFAKDYIVALNAAEALSLMIGNNLDALMYLGATGAGIVLPDVKLAAIQLLINNARHFEGIAADPPDPAFAQPTTLTPRPDLAPVADAPLLEELLAVAEATASEAALAEALLHSMERYQGADQADDGDWALVHARALQDQATLLGAQMARTSTAVGEFLTALDAEAGQFETRVAQLEALRSRIETQGFTEAERAAAASAGVDPSELDDFRTALADQDLSGFTEAWLEALLGDLQASHAAMPAVLGDVATAMQPIVDWLLDDPGTEDLLAVVDAGGPYVGEEGIPVAFDASATTSTSPITSYEWDLDGDGEFDDATGPTPTHTFTEPADGLLGLRVTNAAGANVGYAHLSIIEQDTAPTITAASPQAGAVVVTVGSQQSFSITAIDAEEQPVTVTWALDGAAVGTGTSFAYQPADGDLGLHAVTATATDGSPIGGSSTRMWSVIVQRPDADADGWADNVDCDDTDPAVNPGADEVIGNGIDDDCDPATSDAGSAPTVSITPVAVIVAGEATTFAAQADDADGDIVAYEWDFGDGSTSTEAAPAHTYAAPGSRTVSVTVTDEQGDTATATLDVAVLARPAASFTVSPTRPAPGETVTFTDTSSDADGTIQSWAWTMGDGATSTEQHPTHTFAAPGTHEVTLTVTDADGLTATTTVAVRVVAPGVAAFSTAKLREALDGVAGTGVLASSVFSASTADRATNAIDGLDTTYWRSAAAPAGQQDLRFSLPATAVVHQLRLTLPNNDNAVRQFALQLSTTGSDDADFTTVLTAEATRGPGQVFSFPPTTARYARLVVVSNHGGTTTQVGGVSLSTRDREGGVVSLGDGGPRGRISEVTSEVGSQTAAMLLDGSATSRWRTADGTFPQSATIDLATATDSVVDRVVLTGLAATQSVRAFEVQVATSANPTAFTTVTSGELPMTATPTTFTFPATNASRVRVVVLSNWGYADFTLLGDVAVLDGDGVNVASATAPGNAAVLDVSSQVSSTPGRNAIDYSPSTYWGTPTGTTTGNLTVRLRDAQPYLVDRVDVRGNSSTSSARDVEIQVSNTTSAPGAFVTVASGSIPASTRSQSFMFPAVEARYVRLVVTANHGGTNLQVNDLRVWSPTRGGDTVAFDDLSVVDGEIATWAWDFGDGGSSSEQHPVHTYAAPGTYPVTLTVTDTDGHASSTTMPYTVLDRPQAAFTWTPEVPAEQSTVTFRDASTGALAWRYVSEAFNNDLTSQVATGGFPDDGSWPVTLHIVDAELRTASVTNVVTVTNRPPTANAGVDRTAMWGVAVTVDAQVGDPSPRDLLTLVCDWDFGDGQTAHVEPCNTNNVDVPHAYPHPGTYTATLTVSDGDGGVTTDTRQVTATTRPSFVQVVDTETAGGNVVVTARAFDGPDVFGIEGVDMQIGHGSQSTTVSTGPDGVATATFPLEPGAHTVEAGFAGSSHYDPSATVSKEIVTAPGDIVFIIDESGSMASVQAAVRRNLFDISRTLGEQIDFRIGIVGFGGRQQVEIHLPFTDDLEAVNDVLDALVTTGSFEPGYHATVAAMSDAMGYRPGAGACGVLIGDELPQRNTGQATLQDAIDAARARNAVMFGIVSTEYPEVRAGYGPDPGSLTFETGGDAFDIDGFATNPLPVLDALLDQCVTRIIAPGVGVSINGTPAEVPAGGVVAYTVTVDNDSPGTASGVDLEVELPAGLTLESASDGGAPVPAAPGDPAVVAWPAFTLGGNETVTRTFTARVTAGTPSGALPVVATVVDDGTHGADRDPSDNTATATTSVLGTLAAPIVDAGADRVVEEGATVEVAPTFTDADDPATGTSHTATIDWGTGPEPLTIGVDGTLAATTSTFADDATATVEVCVTDDDGLRGCDSVSITVQNAAPVIAGVADDEIVAGDELAVGPVAFTDAGTVDTHIATVDFGDGSGPAPATVDPAARTVTADHTYTAAGSYTATVCVTDDDGATDCTELHVTVTAANYPPVANAGGPYTAVEGSTFTLDATGSVDPDGDPLTYSWDLDGDGEFDDATGAIPALNHPDDTTFTATLAVTDPSGTTSTATTLVTVVNAAPVISSATVSEGGGPGVPSGHVGVTAHFADAGLADTHTATVRVQGQEVVVDPYLSGTLILVPLTGTGCGIEVTVEIRDDDGGTASATASTAESGSVEGRWLSPLNNNGIARPVTRGQVLPVKLRLEGCDGGYHGSDPLIRVRRGDGVTPGGTMTGPELVPNTAASSQRRGFMRLTGNHYQYNLRADLSPGTWTILVYPEGLDGPSIRHLITVSAPRKCF